MTQYHHCIEILYWFVPEVQQSASCRHQNMSPWKMYFTCRHLRWYMYDHCKWLGDHLDTISQLVRGSFYRGLWNVLIDDKESANQFTLLKFEPICRRERLHQVCKFLFIWSSMYRWVAWNVLAPLVVDTPRERQLAEQIPLVLSRH